MDDKGIQSKFNKQEMIELKKEKGVETISVAT